jgi:hypothetical protein
MKHLQTSLREMAQINTLIINLTRSVELLNFDIDAVEEHALVRSSRDTFGSVAKISRRPSPRCARGSEKSDRPTSIP